MELMVRQIKDRYDEAGESYPKVRNLPLDQCIFIAFYFHM